MIICCGRGGGGGRFMRCGLFGGGGGGTYGAAADAWRGCGYIGRATRFGDSDVSARGRLYGD
jgi:hypothetical protein